MTEPKAKITITVDQQVLASVRTVVADGQAASVSAYIEHAIVGQLAATADFDATISELLHATGGAPTAKERAEARRLLSPGTAA